MKKIAILGSTGSIGRQTLETIKLFPKEISVVLLTAGNNANLLLKQTKIFNPKYIYLNDQSQHEKLKKNLSNKKTKILTHKKDFIKILKSPEIDFVVVALVGISALEPTLAAIEADKNIGLATKEVLVAAGDIVIKKLKAKKGFLIPIDSEHCAIHQCLRGQSPYFPVDNYFPTYPHFNRGTVPKRIILTASGGPFLNLDPKKLKNVGINDVLAHPKWNMGKKITVDSATLMNKGLEVIEAHYLFNVPYEKIEVIIHPQSIIHSMVEFEDGSILAQLSLPDMRLPIQYALTYPKRHPNPWPKLDFKKTKELNFHAPDLKKFPCLKLAYDSGKKGKTFPAVLNAANEEAVKMFLEGKIKFLDIAKLVTMVLKKHQAKGKLDLTKIIKADNWARKEIHRAIKK